MNTKQELRLKTKEKNLVTNSQYQRVSSDNVITTGNTFIDLSSIITTGLFSELCNTKLKETASLLNQEREKSLRLEYELKQHREQSKELVESYEDKLDTSQHRLKREINKRKKIESELKNSHSRLTNLSVYQETAKEDERKRIAREIHDELGSALTALKMDIDWISNTISESDKEVSQKADIMSDLIMKTIQTVQRISRDLRPRLLDDLGLAAAIEWQAEEFSRRTGIECSLYLEPGESYELSAALNTTVFRITQELLTNAARHSQSTHVAITLTLSQKQLVFQVEDNGIGITANQINGNESFGLIGIRERLHPFKGVLAIHGKPNQGTEVEVQIPLA